MWFNGLGEFSPSPSAHARYTGAEAHHFDDLRFLASSFLLGHNILSENDSSKKGTNTRTSHRPDFNHGGFIHLPNVDVTTEKSYTLLLFRPAFTWPRPPRPVKLRLVEHWLFTINMYFVTVLIKCCYLHACRNNCHNICV